MTLGKLRVFRRFTLELGLVQNYMLSKCWRLSQWNYSYLYSWVNVYVLWDWKHIWWLPNSNYFHLGPPRRPKAWEMRPDMPLRPEPMLVKGPMSSYSTVIPPNVKVSQNIWISLVSSFLMNPQHKETPNVLCPAMPWLLQVLSILHTQSFATSSLPVNVQQPMKTPHSTFASVSFVKPLL